MNLENVSNLQKMNLENVSNLQKINSFRNANNKYAFILKFFLSVL